MRSRGWIYAALGGLAFITYLRRQPWLEALDRRFFRQRYDARRILHDVLEEIREAKDFERVAPQLVPQLVARIETALHSKFVAVMARYQALASVPMEYAPPPLAADSKLIAQLHLLGRPLEHLTAGSWIEQRLPRHEISLVRTAGIDLLFPLRSTLVVPRRFWRLA